MANLVGILLVAAGCLGQSGSNPPPRDPLLSRGDVFRALFATDFDRISAENSEKLAADPNPYALMLVEILESHSDGKHQLLNVCGMLAATTAHRAEVRQAVRKMLKKNLEVAEPDYSNALNSGAAAAALGEIGEPSDVPDLLRVLRSRVTVAQNLALEGLAKIADESAIPQIEEIMERHARKSTPDQVKKDKTYERAFEAMAKIKQRAFLKRISQPE